MIERLIVSIRRALAKRRVLKIAKNAGYNVTDFEWLPYDPDSDNICRVVPSEEGFEHQGDDCSCDPIKSLETRDDGETFTLIRHRRMTG